MSEVAGEFLPDGEILATWWTQITPGTTYWRCRVPAKAFPGRVNQIDYADFHLNDEGEPVLERQDGVSIWQYLGNATRGLIASHLQDEGVGVFMEVDDNYLWPSPHIANIKRPWQNKLDSSPNDEYSHQAHRKLIQWMDGVIVSTDTLAEIYSKATSQPVTVCPNSVDLDDWLDVTEKDRPLTFGYAGSGSHRYDLNIIERALDWLSHKRAPLVKIGVDTVEWRWEHENLAWMDSLEDYRVSLQKLDVSFCPLGRSLYHDCKSDIKAIEGAMAGALPIVQADSPVFKDWLDVVPSATTPKEWLKQAKWAFENPSEVKELAKVAKQFVLDTKLIGQHIHKWREAVA